jgi:hypothetical protein
MMITLPAAALPVRRKTAFIGMVREKKNKFI